MLEISEYIKEKKQTYPGYAKTRSIEGGNILIVSNPDIVKLIKLAEGIDPDQEPQTGFFQRFKGKEEIDLDSQLQAIHDLGQSGYYHATNDFCLPKPEIEEQLNHQKASSLAHRTINDAIENLRGDLQLITQPTTPS